jgi:histidine ammonia-lyase
MQVAAWLRKDLAIDAPTAPLHRLQDRYSLRCAPTCSACWPTA